MDYIVWELSSIIIFSRQKSEETPNANGRGQRREELTVDVSGSIDVVREQRHILHVSGKG